MVQRVGEDHKKCPWCGEPVVMLGYPTRRILDEGVVRKSSMQYNPTCYECTVTDLRILIDVETEEEAWEQWDKIQ